MHYFGIFCILKIGIIKEVLAFKNSYLLVILFIVPSFLIVLHMILKDSIYINKKFGVFRCAYIILFMIIYIYENYKLHICELEIIACILAGLDPYIGIMHVDNYNRQAFVFDLIEMYRIYIDKIVFKLFTTKKVKKEHFDKVEGGLYLNKAGKEILI